MKVSELISFLQTQPQDLTVAYRIYSEQAVLKAEDIKVEELCEDRGDGWLQDNRPDRATRPYLVLPGN